jgi:hypothetical protein
VAAADAGFRKNLIDLIGSLRLDSVSAELSFFFGQVARWQVAVMKQLRIWAGVPAFCEHLLQVEQYVLVIAGQWQ